jgi:hypothetical protein
MSREYSSQLVHKITSEIHHIMGTSQRKISSQLPGFQADVSIEEDFFSCQQYERETLPDFFHWFL